MIRVIAICVFQRRDEILVSGGVDTVKQDRFARPLGGGVEQGETSAQAITREIREELKQDITDLRLLGVLENIFEYEGRSGHEIVFVYDGRFSDDSVYALPDLAMFEEDWATPAIWKPLASFGKEYRLVPEGLEQLLAQPAKA
jgi:ADP-ribose pyrophosphatase YjhB (NUDIX family)